MHYMTRDKKFAPSQMKYSSDRVSTVEGGDFFPRSPQ